MVVERVQPAAWKQSNRTKLREEQRVSLRTRQAPVQQFPDVAPTQIDEPTTPTGQEDTAMDDAEKGKRMHSEGVRESPAKKRPRPQPLPEGVTKINNPGGGDCLFHSVSQSLQFVDNKNCNHRQVRAAAVAHLRRHASKYSHFWDLRHPDESLVKIKDLQADFLEYLALLEKVGSWAGNLELAALASTLDRPIYVLHETGQIYGFNQEGSHKNLWIWYSRSQGHYESLQMTNEIALTLRAKALIAKRTGGRQEHRGGGKSTSSLGGLTQKSSSLGGNTRKSTSFEKPVGKFPLLVV